MGKLAAHIRACDGIGRHARFRCCHHSEGFLAVFVLANQQSPLFPAAGEKIGDFIALPRNEIARLTKSTGRFRIYKNIHFYLGSQNLYLIYGIVPFFEKAELPRKIPSTNTVGTGKPCFYKRGSSITLRLGFPFRVKMEGN